MNKKCKALQTYCEQITNRAFMKRVTARDSEPIVSAVEADATKDFPSLPNQIYPPAPGIWCGDSDYTWVSGWYPAATELTILKKAYTSQENLRF